jgi:hypothetical protein
MDGWIDGLGAPLCFQFSTGFSCSVIIYSYFHQYYSRRTAVVQLFLSNRISVSHNPVISSPLSPASALIVKSAIGAVILNTGVVTAESVRSICGLSPVMRIEVRLATGLAVGLATGLIVQFECVARYRLVSSTRKQKEGSSEASKKGRILEVRASSIFEEMGRRRC